MAGVWECGDKGKPPGHRPPLSQEDGGTPMDMGAPAGMCEGKSGSWVTGQDGNARDDCVGQSRQRWVSECLTFL